jgi:hypothetical protein
MAEFEGFVAVADVLALSGAMTDEERAEFLGEQRSRERLDAMIREALVDGPVEVYACGAGDEEAAIDREEVVEVGWVVKSVAPLSERVRYAIRTRA